jgi:hypothetical protein
LNLNSKQRSHFDHQPLFNYSRDIPIATPIARRKGNVKLEGEHTKRAWAEGLEVAQGVSEQEAPQKPMEEQSREFIDKGSEFAQRPNPF